MKTLLMPLLAGVCLVAIPALGQTDARSNTVPGDPSEFVETGTWWNLFFSQGNDPLRRGTGSINAVKIMRVSKTHPEWIKIAFPKKRKEHYSIFGPAAKAHDDDSVDLYAALADWEKSISEWKVIWVNLNFVVHMSKVEPSHVPKLVDGSVSSVESSPAAR